MSAQEIELAVAIGFLGIAAGVAVARHYFRRGGSARTKLIFSLTEVLHLDEATTGIDLSMKVGTYNVKNLQIFKLTVRNAGPGDVVLDDAMDETKHSLRPRLELPSGLRVIVDPWTPGESTPRSDVRVARSLRDGVATLYIHLHRLAEGSQATAMLVCTVRSATVVPVHERQEFSFFPGFLPDAEIRTEGLLFPAPSYLT